MDSLTQFIALMVLALAGIFIVWLRRTAFAYLPKGRIRVSPYMMDFIEWILISWPPLVPLVTIVNNASEDMGWYLVPYFGLIMIIFVIWFNTTPDTRQRRQAYPAVITVIVIWIIIGLILLQRIIQ